MYRARFLPLLLLVSACGDPALPEGVSTFRVTSYFSPTSPGTNDEVSYPRSPTTWLELAPTDARSGTATLRAFGLLTLGTYTISGRRVDVTFPEGTFFPDPDFEDTGIDCQTIQIRYASMSLRGQDGDGDGTIDTFDGRATGTALHTEGDALRMVEVSGRAAAIRDLEGPRLVANPSGNLNPFATITVLAHEPVAWTDLDLRSAEGAVLEASAFTSPTPTAEWVSSWIRAPSTPLAFGTTYTVDADEGIAVDMEGFDSTPARFTTVARPSPFTGADFETSANGLFGGGANVTNGSAPFTPVVEGQNALYMPQGGTFTAAFSAPSAATLTVRLRYQAAPGATMTGTPLELTFFDGGTISTATFAPPGSITWLADDAAIEVSEVVTQQFTVPSFANDGDFNVRFAVPGTGPACGSLPAPAPHSIVVESITLE